MNDNKFGYDNSMGSMGSSNVGHQTPGNIGSTSSFGSNVGSSSSGNSILGNLGGLSGILNKVGINSSTMSSMRDSMGNMKMGDSVTKARGYAAANPGKVLGGLAALVIGAGMLRGRTVR